MYFGVISLDSISIYTFLYYGSFKPYFKQINSKNLIIILFTNLIWRLMEDEV